MGPEPLDVIRKIRGIGGTEYVYEKHIDKIKLGARTLTNFKILIGDMNFGIDIDIGGILGMDYLTKSRVVIDLENMILV